MISTEDDSMSAAENIPVSKETYNQILDLRAPGETLDETLARLVERIKKQRLTDDIEEVMAKGEFVELDCDIADKNPTLENCPTVGIGLNLMEV